MAINEKIRSSVEDAIAEMGMTHKERLHILKGLWVALVGKQHMLMLGPGGTGKSFLVRDLAARITGAQYYETALDETSDPGQVVGPVDIKSMKEQGRYRRVTANMLPEADIGFIDEFFNANGPVLHLLQPILNERIFHNNGVPTPTPLWSAFMGTNKLNADADQAALWDRVHHRYIIRYVSDRDNLRDILRENMLRRVSSYQEPTKATISRDDLVIAHDEAMQLTVPENVLDTFLDIREELLHNGIEVSTRRMNEGFAAILSNAWVNGHDPVTVADLDALQHMWWLLQEQADTARNIILGATNPGEKAALEYMDELEKYKADLKAAQAQDLDQTKLRLAGMEVFKNTKRIIGEADELEAKANAAGASIARVQELRNRAKALQDTVQREFFNL